MTKSWHLNAVLARQARKFSAVLDFCRRIRHSRRIVTKAELLECIREELRTRLDRLMRAAREAHQAATDPGSKAEGKYDTRSLEASYLASGQSRQVDELAEALRIFEALTLTDFGVGEPIDAGAWVEVALASGKASFLLAPAAGGMEIPDGASEITVLTPDSPLYRKLSGLRVGDVLEQPAMTIVQVK
jgi:predicted ATPase